MEGDGPGIQKNGFDIEDDENQSKHVIADIELNPSPANGLHAGLIGELPFSGAAPGRHELVGDQRQGRNSGGDQQEAQKGVIAGQGKHECPA